MNKVVSSARILFLVSFIWLIGLNPFSDKMLWAQCTELLWADEFNAIEIDNTKWTIEIDGDGGGNSELQYYTDREENISVIDGMLVIKALKEDYLEHDYTSAKLYTQYKGDWRYGRIEARIKLPEGQGLWPAFWMLSTENIFGKWPNSGEIDIVELVGGGSGDSTIYGTLHVGPPWNYSNGIYKLSGQKFSDDFHVFAIEWSPEKIDWFVDDILYSTKTASDVSHWLPFQERFYVILNLAVGGNWPGSPDETTVFPQTMEIDYVRVYGEPKDQGIVAIDSAYPNGSRARYSFTQAPDATFNWTIDAADATILSSTDSNIFDVKWGCQTGTINLEVNYTNCKAFLYTLPVTFSNPIIEGYNYVLQNQQHVNFKVPTMESTSFKWNFPEGVQIISEPDSNEIQVIWGCFPGEIGVEISNECNVNVVSSTVLLSEPVLTGPSTVIANSENVSYAITELPGASYQWSVPEDAVIVQGQYSPRIQVNYGDLSGQVKVVFDNHCTIDSFIIPVTITDTIILCDYESTFLTFKGWDDGVEPYFTKNPFKNDVNSSENVGAGFKAASPWSGLYADLGYNLDLLLHNRFSIKVLGPKSGDILFKIEDVGEGIDPLQEDPKEVAPKEIKAAYTTPNEWQYLTFNFNGADPADYDRVTLFFDFGSEDTNTYYFDEIRVLPADTVYLKQKNIDSIVEGSEDGNRIMVKVWYDKFNEALNPIYWNFDNLPDGVQVDNWSQISKDTMVLTLRGNATEDYDTNIQNFTTFIQKEALQKTKYDLMVSNGVVFEAIIEDGIEIDHIEPLMIKPNPISDYFIVQAQKKISEIVIYNLNGQKVFYKNNLSGKREQVNVFGLQTGTYVVLVKLSNNKYAINQIVKIK